MEEGFTEIVKNVFLFKDVVNVYLIKYKFKAILIDIGSGKCLNHLRDIGVQKIDYLFYTHYHRDQNFGSKLVLKTKHKKLQRHQQTLFAGSYKERKLFSEAEEFWKRKSYYDIYYFKPSFLVSTFNIPLDLTFKDGDELDWNTFQIKILETPGHTTGSVSYIVEIDGKNYAFTGDLIHSGGKVINYYDLEYIYNDNGEWGIKWSIRSFKKLLKYKPEILFPSHGAIIKQPKEDIDKLREKFKRARFIFCSKSSSVDLRNYFGDFFRKKMKKINIKKEFQHLIHHGRRPPYIVLGNNKNCFIVDYAGTGYAFAWPEKKLFKILKERGITEIDFIIPTHYHDDHVAGIPLLQQKYGVKVYALEHMVDILQNPTHYRLGCLIDEPIKVDRVFKDGEKFQWDDYEFTIYHFPGQTEYHMAMQGEIDGKNVFFIGDSMTPRFLIDRQTNLNALNYCQIGTDVGQMKCADILLKVAPEYIAISHYGIVKVSDNDLRTYKEYVSEYEPFFSDIVPQENPNFGFDPNWIHFKPIRIDCKLGETISTNLVIRNYLDRNVKASYKINFPLSWKRSSFEGEIEVGAKQNVMIPLQIQIPAETSQKGQKIITADIIFDGKPLGPVPDLMLNCAFTPPDSWGAWNPQKKESLLIWIGNRMKESKKFFK
ncbi:MAG: MBL fold metallo-hydrolase [Promethearchaeota archaeon]